MWVLFYYDVVWSLNKFTGFSATHILNKNIKTNKSSFCWIAFLESKAQPKIQKPVRLLHGVFRTYFSRLLVDSSRHFRFVFDWFCEYFD